MNIIINDSYAIFIWKFQNGTQNESFSVLDNYQH